jgi:hypothetical protein
MKLTKHHHALLSCTLGGALWEEKYKVLPLKRLEDAYFYLRPVKPTVEEAQWAALVLRDKIREAKLGTVCLTARMMFKLPWKDGSAILEQLKLLEAYFLAIGGSHAEPLPLPRGGRKRRRFVCL